MKYKKAILGGTFDHLHEGHKHFINDAVGKSENLIIGLAKGALLSGKIFVSSIEDYEVRKKNLEDFISDGNVKILPIEDFYGNSLEEKDIDAIFVTSHGLPNAKLINKMRLQKGLPPLKINVVSFLRGEDGKIISSTRIRAGEIDRGGRLYMSVFDRTLFLPPSLRSKVAKIPSGKIVRAPEKVIGEYVIAIGDVVSNRLLEAGRQADLSVVDLKTERKLYPKNNLKTDFLVRNKPGVINKQAVSALKKALKKSLGKAGKTVIQIIGEEDLMPLPAVLLAPLGSTVLYGVPGHGAVVVKVSEEKKEEAKNILEQFSKVS